MYKGNLKDTAPYELTWLFTKDVKHDLNDFGRLKWTVENPAMLADFLDVSLTIQDGRIVSRTHQKKLNLYLYLAGSSAHTPSTLKSLIFGEMRRYCLTNTYSQDYVHFAALLLRYRGRDLKSAVRIQYYGFVAWILRSGCQDCGI